MPIVSVDQPQHSATRLPRSLSPLETWGFGLTAHLTWISTAPGLNVAIGTCAIFIWLPIMLISMLMNFQVKRLGEHWPEIAGGTPNYMIRLLGNYPYLARYAAMGYYLGWVSIPPVAAIVLTDLIQNKLVQLGVSCPVTFLRIGFTGIAYVVAFSGTRALGILHLFFILPAVGFILVFCTQGIGWLALSPQSPGFFPTSWSSLTFQDWAKWYFVAAYGGYGCETAAAFVADSRNPSETLRFLKLAAWLLIPIHLGGTWVLARLATSPELGDNSFLNVLAATLPFWGTWASLLVTLLFTCCALLGCATTVMIAPRILYQLGLDGHLSPIFAVVSRAGVLIPGLLLTLFLSIICLIWGDISSIVTITGTSWLGSIAIFHLALWLCRGKPEVQWPWLSLGFFVLEAVVLLFAGWAWGWLNVLVGLLFPIALLAADAAMRRSSFPPFHPPWWSKLERLGFYNQNKDFVAVQVVILLLLVCGAAVIAWSIRDIFEQANINAKSDMLVIVLLTLAFMAIAIACWTTLPQIASIAEAREQAENLFITALDTVPDTVLVLDESGVIVQTNPAAEKLFARKTERLIGYHLRDLLPELLGTPEVWAKVSEQILQEADCNLRIVEATISRRTNRQMKEYIAILRDITDRKQSEETLRQNEETARKQAKQLEQTLQDLKTTQAQLIQTEKMSSLGQLVAGVAHEINNPVNFIHGNLVHVDNYSQNLIDLINLYQKRYPQNDTEIENFIEEIEFYFLLEDFPKILASLKAGANRIREIVLSLRNFSRLDEADMKTVNIHEGIDNTLLILQNEIKRKNEIPAIIINKKYGQLPEVDCYAGQLNQVFMNILSNAIYALHQRDKERSKAEIENQPSQITIATQVIDHNWLKISIKDNGPGISNSISNRIFDPFFTTKPIGSGTGLGLSISYQIIVKKHAGRLWCASELGEGAEFVIEIPIRQKYS